MIGLSAHAPLLVFLLGISSVTAWVVPAILFVLVVIASWMGVRWAFSHEMSALRSAPLFNGLSTRQLRSILSSAVPHRVLPWGDDREGGRGKRRLLHHQGGYGQGCRWRNRESDTGPEELLRRDLSHRWWPPDGNRRRPDQGFRVATHLARIDAHARALSLDHSSDLSQAEGVAAGRGRFRSLR